MKKCKYYLSAALCTLFLLFFPMHTEAAWTPQPLPAASVDTVFGDSRYIDPAWMTKKVTITYQGTSWMTGMDAFKDMPVPVSYTHLDVYKRQLHQSVHTGIADRNCPLYHAVSPQDKSTQYRK